jgi:multisubunit Na+/H+ antiporter MnhB subunit
MKKNDWKYAIDTLMFVSLIGIVVVGLLLAFVIPRGSAPDGAKVFLDIHRHDWGNIHLYLSLAFTAFVAIHILLNWDWVKCMAKKKFKKGWAGALALTVVLSFLILAVLWSLQPEYQGGEREGAGRGRQGRAAGTARPGGTP